MSCKALLLFFFNDTATTEIYTLSLHDALPIFAKIASGWQKPDGLTVIAPERVEQFLQQLPVEALWGVGPVTAKKLRAVGIARLVDVRSADRELLSQIGRAHV